MYHKSIFFVKSVDNGDQAKVQDGCLMENSPELIWWINCVSMLPKHNYKSCNVD